MNVTLKDMKTITKGCLAVEDTDHGFVFRRMTEKQLAAVDDVPRYRDRARFCAGVRLDFLTDAAALSFSYEILNFDPARSFFCFDVYVDDVLVHTVSEKPITHRNGVLSCPLSGPETLRHVTIYLPHSSSCALRDFVLRDAARLLPAPGRGGLLLCYGDSITQGYDALHPSLTYAAVLSRLLGMELLNQGISGYVFDSATIDSDHGNVPSLVLSAYGTNDWTNKPSMDMIQSDIDRFLDTLTEAFPKSRLGLILPIWRGDCQERTEAGGFPEVLRLIRASAHRHPRLELFDGQKAVPHCPEFFADGLLHPNDAGMLLYAQWLAGRLR